MRRVRAASFFILAASLALTALSTPAMAATPAQVSPSQQSAGTDAEKCTAEATSRRLAAWSCIGSVLIPAGPEAAIDHLTTLAKVQQSPATGAASTTALQADDYDFWCESTGVCTRRISNYISETKGNIFYGYNSQTVGSFDLILRTNLNGRQAQSRVTLDWDSGPQLYFEYVNVNCFEEESAFPDSNCGVHRAGSGVFIGPGGAYRYTSGLIYGNRLNDSNEYYSTISARFRPTGYSTLTFGYLIGSALFRCYGNDNCYFP